MIFSIWFLYSFWITFYGLSNDTKNFHIFGKKYFAALWCLMTSYHVTTKITKMSLYFFFFSLFSHKKHFYEQNMLVTRVLERDYIWVFTSPMVMKRLTVGYTNILEKAEFTASIRAALEIPPYCRLDYKNSLNIHWNRWGKSKYWLLEYCIS